jgi:hydrogenase maturation protease
VKTLLLGLGNPILRDDSVGLRVVRELEKRMVNEDVHIEEATFANIDILDIVSSYDRLIIVDSIKTNGGRPGQLYPLGLEDFQSTLHLSCPHDINLATALELGRQLEIQIPKEIRIYAIEVEDNQTFSEACSPSVERAIPGIVEKIAQAECLKLDTRNLEFEAKMLNPRLEPPNSKQTQMSLPTGRQAKHKTQSV